MQFYLTSVYVILSCMTWALVIIAILGIGNFAIQRAVLEEARVSPAAVPEFLARLGARLTVVAEFGVLLAALLLAANGWPDLAWAYLAYTALNGMAAWFILRRSV